ncbi:MAG: VCBS repeat-containing protein, partial [Planctomycetota bacterium]
MKTPAFEIRSNQNWRQTIRMLLLISITFLFFTAWAVAQNSGVKFQAKLLVVDANEGIDIADINQDGLPDVVAGRFWFQAPDFAVRPLRNIDDWNGYIQSNGDFCHDVDGDGWIDVIAGSFLPTEVYWYRNPGAAKLKQGVLWEKKLLVDTQLGQNEASFLRDLDGDGEVEWISNSWNKNNPMVIWGFKTEQRERKVKKGKGKKAKTIKESYAAPTLQKFIVGPSNGHGIGFGDINNDGREDILFANGWYERPESNSMTQP